MSGILDMLMSQLGGKELGNLGRQVGASEDTMSKAVAAALPMLLGALKRNASSGAGAEALNSALDRHDGGILDNIGDFLNQSPSDSDDRMLGHIFGNKRATVERSLENSAGLGQGMGGNLLKNLAPLLLGAMGKSKRQQSGFSLNDLTSMLGQEAETVSRKQPEANGLIEQLLDSDGDGDVDLSDMMKKGGGLLGSLLGR